MNARLLNRGMSLVESWCALVPAYRFPPWQRRCLERVTNGEFEIVHVRKAEQHADFLTKPLHTEAFRFYIVKNLCFKSFVLSLHTPVEST